MGIGWGPESERRALKHCAERRLPTALCGPTWPSERWLAPTRVLGLVRFLPMVCRPMLLVLRPQLHSPNLLLQLPEPRRAPVLGKALVLELRCLGPAQNSPPQVQERALSVDSESRVPRQLPTGLLPQRVQFYRSTRWPAPPEAGLPQLQVQAQWPPVQAQAQLPQGQVQARRRLGLPPARLALLGCLRAPPLPIAGVRSARARRRP